MTTTTEDILARLADAARLRRGTVTAARPGAVRVDFADHDGVTSYWLDILFDFTGDDQHQHTYPLGSRVWALTDERGEAGIVLGASYSEANPPPLQNLGQILWLLNAGVKLLVERDAPGPQVTLKVGPNTIVLNNAGIDVSSPRIRVSARRVKLVIERLRTFIGSYRGGPYMGSLLDDPDPPYDDPTTPKVP